MKKNRNGFTLIELIVAIGILAVLLTIAFFSFSQYSRYSRDSVRITDLKSVKTALELYEIDAGKYPRPDNSKEVTFNFNTVVWDQWTVDENLISRLDRINKVPLDPRYETKYTYSLVRDGHEYQLWSIAEAGWEVWYNPIINNTYAKAASNVDAIVEWNYNEVSVLFKMEWLYVMFALPSIILADLDSNIELSEIWTWTVVLRWKKCLPHSYKNFSDPCLVDFTPQLLFIWSNLPVTEEDIMAIIEQLQTIYSAPIFSWDSQYDTIAGTDITNTWSSVDLFTNVIDDQVPDYVLNTWEEIVEIWVDAYIATYWSWAVDLISWGSTGWASSPETWITFLNVNIADLDWWSVNCASCIDF